MDHVFADAFLLKQPPVCLGRRLLPFSLGHSLVLEAIGSPVLGAGECAPGDLAVAVMVCAQPATDLSKPLDFAKTAQNFREWGKSCDLAQFKDDLDAFRAYVAEFCTAPERWSSGGAGRGPRAPWQYTIVTALRQHLKLGYNEAWNCPVNRALADYAALGEALGDESLISEEEKAEIEEAHRG